MNRTDCQHILRETVRQDEAMAKRAAVEAVAQRAPYSYAELKAASRAGALVELLVELDAYTLRAQAVRYTLEGPVGLNEDEVERRFIRILTTARFGQAA